MLQGKETKALIFIIDIIIVFILIIATYNFAKKSFINSFTAGKELMKEDNVSLEEGTEYKIVIEETKNIYEVSKELLDKNIIDSRIMFTLENLVFGNRSDVVAGTYTVNTAMENRELGAAFKKNITSASGEVTFTIPEGYSIHEIAQFLDAKGIVSYDSFIESTKNDIFDYEFLTPIKGRNNYLEGYLFPDTYRVFNGSEPKVIIDKMLTRFDEMYSSEIKAKAEAMGLSNDDIIKVASIIEKEINVGEERALCASVIYNKLNAGMNLQMCSTIIYVVDKRKENLQESDLTVDSPYNTYTNKGLPVGPISNPGLECIIAAVNPANVDYLYFVVNDTKIGSHFFTNNYDEFLNAKKEFNQKF